MYSRHGLRCGYFRSCRGGPPAIKLDNASFHRKRVLYEIAERMGFILIFLPKYSPDKNSIEHTWANMKRWLRSHAKEFATIKEAIYYYFDFASTG